MTQTNSPFYITHQETNEKLKKNWETIITIKSFRMGLLQQPIAYMLI